MNRYLPKWTISCLLLFAVSHCAQVGLGNQRGLEFTSAVQSLQQSPGHKLIQFFDNLTLSVSSANTGLHGMPLAIVADFRNKHVQTGILQLPGEINALGVTSNYFSLVGNLGSLPPIFPGTYTVPTTGDVTFSGALPDWSGLGDVSLWTQTLCLDPAAPNGVAISRTLRHDVATTPLGSQVTPAGASQDQFMAYSLLTADLDGDGSDEIIAGAPGATVGGLQGAGRVIITWGPNQTTQTTVDAPAPQTGAWFGSWLEVADLDGDGNPDLIVGAREESIGALTGAGAVYIMSGPGFTTFTRLQSPTAEFGARFGHAVTCADWNGDGQLDVVVGEPKATSGGFIQAGRVHVFEGAAYSNVTTIECPNAAPGTKFGYAIDGGDLDGDGSDDLAVGAPFQHVGGTTVDSGAGYIFVSTSVTPTYTIEQTSEYALLGDAVVMTDLNLDGNLDVVFGAEFDNESGVSDAGSLHVAMGPNFTNRFEILPPQPLNHGGFGSDLCASDINHDGFPDLVVGEFWADIGPDARSGDGWILLGPSFEQAIQLLPTYTQTDGRRGRRVACGDLDGDGIGDAILGAPFASPGGAGALHDGELFIYQY